MEMAVPRVVAGLGVKDRVNGGPVVVVGPVDKLGLGSICIAVGGLVLLNLLGFAVPEIVGILLMETVAEVVLMVEVGSCLIGCCCFCRVVTACKGDCCC